MKAPENRGNKVYEFDVNNSLVLSIEIFFNGLNFKIILILLKRSSIRVECILKVKTIIAP